MLKINIPWLLRCVSDISLSCMNRTKVLALTADKKNIKIAQKILKGFWETANYTLSEKTS